MAMFLSLKAIMVAPITTVDIVGARLTSSGSIRVDGSSTSSLGTYLGGVADLGNDAISYDCPVLHRYHVHIPFDQELPVRTSQLVWQPGWSKIVPP